jgi:hypothetical protein
MEYRLTGYRQIENFRIFDFDRVDSDGGAVKISVGVDTTLAGKYAVGLQELPLLCRQFLEKSAIAGESVSLTFPETDLAAVAAASVAMRARRRRSTTVRRKQNRTPNHPMGGPI